MDFPPSKIQNTKYAISLFLSIVLAFFTFNSSLAMSKNEIISDDFAKMTTADATKYISDVYKKFDNNRYAVARDLFRRGFSCLRSKNKDSTNQYYYRCTYLLCLDIRRTRWKSVIMSVGGLNLGKEIKGGGVVNYSGSCSLADHAKTNSIFRQNGMVDFQK